MLVALRVANGPLKHQKPQFSPGRTEVSGRYGWAGRLPWGLQVHKNRPLRHNKPSFAYENSRVLWSGGPFFRSFRSLTHSSTQMRPSKQLSVLKKLMYSLDRCSHDHRWSLNVELLAMSNCLQSRTTCNVELLAMSNLLPPWYHNGNRVHPR